MDWIKAVEAVAILVGLFGLYCMGKYLSDTLFMPREIAVAVTVTDERSRENADILITVMKKSVRGAVGRRICVFVSQRYSDDRELLEMISSANAECYVIKEN